MATGAWTFSMDADTVKERNKKGHFDYFDKEKKQGMSNALFFDSCPQPGPLAVPLSPLAPAMDLCGFAKLMVAL